MGYLIGAMLNPFTFIPVALVMYAQRRRALYAQFVISLAAVLLVAVALYSLDDYLMLAEKVRGTMAGLFSAAVWFAIIAAIRRSFTRKRDD